METSDGQWSERDELILRAAARVRRGLHRHPFSGLLVFRGERYAEAVDATLAEFVPAGVPLSVVCADLDRFKRINDSHGHAVGDEVLAATGAALRDLVRPLDMVLAEAATCTSWCCSAPGSRWRRPEPRRPAVLLGQLTFGGTPMAVTASFGVATHNGSETAMALVERASTAEQRAKALGRDRVEVADDA